jgi:hypothetical protein
MSAIAAAVGGRSPLPRRLALAAALGYPLVFAALAAYGPGLGIGQGFYLPISFAALAGGPAAGGVAGAVAMALYQTALFLRNGDFSAALTVSAAIHLAGYVVTGFVLGAFAQRARRLIGDALAVLDDLLALTQRDLATGVSDSEGLHAAINDRIKRKAGFVLLLGEPVEASGRDVSDARERQLRELAAMLVARLPCDEVARIGASQIALLLPPGALGAASEANAAAEQALDEAGLPMTFGWAVSPSDASDPLALLAVATERLYARKFARGEWRPTAASTGLVAEFPQAGRRRRR